MHDLYTKDYSGLANKIPNFVTFGIHCVLRAVYDIFWYGN